MNEMFVTTGFQAINLFSSSSGSFTTVKASVHPILKQPQLYYRCPKVILGEQVSGTLKKKKNMLQWETPT